eukprot:617303-Rhodomonas_salina.1
MSEGPLQWPLNWPCNPRRAIPGPTSTLRPRLRSAPPSSSWLRLRPPRPAAPPLRSSVPRGNLVSHLT